MSRGTITNVATRQTLTGEYGKRNNGQDNTFYFEPDGTEQTVIFYKKDWEYKADPEPFFPGTVVRAGNDPSLFIRNNDGTWTYVHLGYRPGSVKPHSRVDVYTNDESVRSSDVYKVVYASQAPRHA